MDLLRARQDARDLVGKLLDDGGDALETCACLMYLLDAFRDAILLILHDLEGLLDALGVVRDQGRDFLRGMFGLLGELADFFRHDGEAASLLAGACRFDRGVQRQEVRLAGDVGDHLDDFGDALGAFVEGSDGIRHPLGALVENLHSIDRDDQALLSFGRGFFHALHGMRDVVDARVDLVHGLGDVADGFQRIVDDRGLLLRVVGDLDDGG